MIANNWAKMIVKANITQNQLADAVGLNKGELSRVCSGKAVLAWDTLVACCAKLNCVPVDIYGENELMVLYQVGVAEKPKRSPRIRVQLCETACRLIDRAVDAGDYSSRREAVNDIIQEHLK